MEFGVATHDDQDEFVAGNPDSEHPASLLWRAPASVLEHLEQARNGAPIALTFQARGSVSANLPPFGGPGLSMRLPPQSFGGNISVEYSRDAWTTMLKKVSFGLHVLVEVPLAPAPPAPWNDVWQALREAHESFDQGGTTGWSSCVRSIRLALERWQAHEREQQGPGWNAPARQDREQRTAHERIDNLRWHLLQCAHRAAHTGADEWSRDEAVLMLSTCAALLRYRNP
ncbi:MAG TPA: hypothetical protein VGL61_31485 [Kofleriaceae bacterium]|jgi:hypothetical protein